MLRAKCARSKKVSLVAWHFADELGKKKTVEMGLKEELLNIIEQNSKDEVQSSTFRIPIHCFVFLVT